MKAKKDRNAFAAPGQLDFSLARWPFSISTEPALPFVGTGEEIAGSRQRTEPIAENDNPAYKDRTIEAVIVGVAAEQLSRVYPAEDVQKAIKYLAALQAAREMPGCAPAELSPGQGAELLEDTRLAHQREHRQRQESRSPATVFTSNEDGPPTGRIRTATCSAEHPIKLTSNTADLTINSAESFTVSV